MNDKFVDMPKCMADKYETADFISSDPVQFPRRYSGRDAGHGLTHEDTYSFELFRIMDE